MKTFPLDYILECSLYKNSEGKAEIHCIVHDEINLHSLFVEQQIIRDGIKELFIISKINSTKIKCNMTNEDNENVNIVTSIFHNEESPSEETNGEERSNESKEESPDNNNSNGTMPNNNPPMPHTLPLNEYITDSIDDTTHKINESNIIKTENKNNSELNIELNGTNSTVIDQDKSDSTYNYMSSSSGSSPQSSRPLVSSHKSSGSSSGSTSQSSLSSGSSSGATHHPTVSSKKLSGSSSGSSAQSSEPSISSSGSTPQPTISSRSSTGTTYHLTVSSEKSSGSSSESTIQSSELITQAIESKNQPKESTFQSTESATQPLGILESTESKLVKDSESETYQYQTKPEKIQPDSTFESGKIIEKDFITDNQTSNNVLNSNNNKEIMK
jgi:hypothetical protein